VFSEDALKRTGQDCQAAKRAGRHPPGLRTLLSLAASRSGAATVEYALVGLLFFAMMISVIEFGRVMWTLNALHYGAQQAARCAAINSSLCGTNDLLQAWAAGIGGSGLPGTAFTLDTGAACGMQVTASYTMTLIIPYMKMNPTLTSSACFPKSS
jgi:Flp pilus assembly protein TadG